MNKKLEYYILSENGITIPVDFRTFLESLRTADWNIEKTKIGDAEVSTVFLGLDHNYYFPGPPLLFETMIFGGAHNHELWRYSTFEQARIGHQQVVDKLRGENQ